MLPSIFNPNFNRSSLLSPFANRRSLFDDFFLNPLGSFEALGSDVSETHEHITVRVPLNGIQPEKCDVTIDNGVLIIKGSHNESTNEGDRYSRSYSSSFSQTVRLPHNVIESQAKATIENGTLVVSMPKLPSQSEVAKSIEVPITIKALEAENSDKAETKNK